MKRVGHDIGGSFRAGTAFDASAGKLYEFGDESVTVMAAWPRPAPRCRAAPAARGGDEHHPTPRDRRHDARRGPQAAQLRGILLCRGRRGPHGFLPCPRAGAGHGELGARA